MKTLLAEQPLLLTLMLGVLAAAMIFGWLQTGKKAAGILGILVALFIPVAWVVADNWVTEREQIEIFLDRVADDVANNRHEPLLELIADDETRAQARGELPRYEFSSARVTSVRSIKLIDETASQLAEADIVVQVIASEVRGSLKNIKVPRRVILQLRRKGPESWVITGYQHGPLTGGPDGYSSRPLGQ